MPYEVRTWALVAGDAGARILRLAGSGEPASVLRAFLNEGRSASRGLPDAAPEPTRDALPCEPRAFARELASALARAADDHAFDALVLVAPPAMLGALRAELGPAVRRRVEHELEKDLTRVPERDLALALARLAE